MSEQKAESPVILTRGLWSPTSFWEAIRNILPSKPPSSNNSPGLADQTGIDVWSHFTASQPVVQNEEPIYIHPIDGLADLSGQIQGKNTFPDSIGGYGDVWKCFWVDENKRVAVKAIRIQSDVKDREKKTRRLCREARTWAILENTHILPLLGLTWGFGPLPALVCPWVENGSLNNYLELNHVSLSMWERFYILQGVVSAVLYLHSRKVIHGDITGSNILIDERGEPLLADFGLSFLNIELTGNSYSTSHYPGSVQWAAPELFIPLDDGSQCRACVKSDIYSVGCVMLQVLSGRVPYGNWTTPMVIHGKFMGQEPLRLPEASIDERHWEFMRRCWREKQERTVELKEIATFIERELNLEDAPRRNGRL